MNLFKAGCLSSFTNSSLDQGSDGTLREFGNQVQLLANPILRHFKHNLEIIAIIIIISGYSRNVTARIAHFKPGLVDVGHAR